MILANQNHLDDLGCILIRDMIRVLNEQIYPNHARDDITIHESEALWKIAKGYLDAINALLHAHVNLYNEMIEDPDMIKLRRFCR